MIKDVIMATDSNIRLPELLLAQVQEAAREQNMTPDEWLIETARRRLEQDKAVDRLRSFSRSNRRDMAELGVKPSDVAKEIINSRQGR